MAPLSSSPTSKTKPHIVLFPFMSKGHTIPVLHLAQLLHHRGVDVTIFTTPANHPFIAQSLPDATASIVDLPFPDNIQGIPQGAESTDKLPSVTSSMFISFVIGLKSMQPAFEQELQKLLPHITCIISDGFLSWTLEPASRLGIPRLCFFGMNYYAGAVCQNAATNGLMSMHESDDEPFTLPAFPWIQLTRNDFTEPFNKRDPRGPHLDFIIESMTATANSYGLLVNTFYELEPLFADYYNRECQPRAWSIGPFCLAKLQKQKHDSKPRWIDWLDQKLAQASPVLYIAFGSQVRISPTQMSEIAQGLEESEVSFLWVARKSDIELLNNSFESKVEERGMVVKEWVDQEEILEHPIVQGFLSHCGWNSVMEGICAGVPILAWPMMAEQHLNAKMVVEEIKVGLRVKTIDGISKGFVAAASLSSAVRELMKNGAGKQLREKAKEVAEAAKKAMGEGGSSWNALNSLISELQKKKEVINTSKPCTY